MELSNAVVYGTALGAGQLNASSATSGTFTYNPAPGTLLAVGARTLSVELIPSNSSVYSNAAASVSLTVNPAHLTITAENRTREVGAANPPR